MAEEAVGAEAVRAEGRGSEVRRQDEVEGGEENDDDEVAEEAERAGGEEGALETARSDQAELEHGRQVQREVVDETAVSVEGVGM